MTAGIEPLLSSELVLRAVELLRVDPVVIENARWRRAEFSLVEHDQVDRRFVVADGTVQAESADAAEYPTGYPTVRISGTRAQWQVIVDGQHGGLHRAWRYGGLAFDGDTVATLDFWKTIWRLGDALAAAVSGRGSRAL